MKKTNNAVGVNMYVDGGLNDAGAGDTAIINGGATPLINPYRGIPMQAASNSALADSRQSLLSKLAENARMAAQLDRVDPKAAGYLRSCHPAGFHCNLPKYCRLCGRVRAYRLVKRNHGRLHSIRRPFHLTLSAPSVSRLTKHALQDLIQRFRLLRGSRPFRRMVMGGLGNIEFAYDDSGCMAHIHAVIDGRAGLSVERVRQVWFQLGGGHQVHLQAIKDGTTPKTLAYSAQQPDLPDDIDHLRDFYWATKGVKLTLSWGTMHHAYGRPFPQNKRTA